ncbi:unnamed protein product [Dicrocoelium dendriticum]|nr:unnamed protein product [Dicrocoelium dendriticum]
MVESLHSAIKKVKAVGDARVLVLRGAGRFFSAGHYLKELVQSENPGSVAQLFSASSQMMLDLTQLEIPSIAAVHGPAYAAGCQLVATCDLAVAGQSATFATPGVKLGLFCTTPAVALVRAIGLRAAKELLLTGRNITAERAYALGLVHRVVPDDQVFEAGLTLAREIAQHSRPVVCLGKRAVSTQMSLDLPDAYEYANQVMLQNLELEDTKKGIEAFLNKQPMPQWTDKSD